MEQYKKLAKQLLKYGAKRIDRTQTGTISLFGLQAIYDLNDGFPLLTTKKMFYKAIVYELLWFLKGGTNIKYLVDHNVNIWNEWAFQNYCNSSSYKKENIKEFIGKIKNNEIFSKKWGELGPIYGKQWTDFNGINQLKKVINDIKHNPTSRRLIITAWNPSQIDQMILPPCHTFMQFYVHNDKSLSLKLYQRSADLFLGVPFNIASYALLLSLIAKECNLKPKNFIHTFGDIHIYNNHIDLIKEQIKRKSLNLCELSINDDVKSIFDYKYSDIQFKNYISHDKIIGKVSV